MWKCYFGNFFKFEIISKLKRKKVRRLRHCWVALRTTAGQLLRGNTLINPHPQCPGGRMATCLAPERLVRLNSDVCVCVLLSKEKKKESQNPAERNVVSLAHNSHSLQHQAEFWAKSHKTHDVVSEQPRCWCPSFTKLCKWPSGEPHSDKTQTSCPGKQETNNLFQGQL